MTRIGSAVLAVMLVGCRGSASSEPEAGARVPPSATPEASDAAPLAVTSQGTSQGTAPPTPAATVAGDWERVTEPYRGLVIRIEARGDVLEGTVVSPSRPASSTPPLACQASLWKAGEHYLKLQENKGSIVVRDWGFTGGVCRHADAKAKVEAHLEDAELVLSVTRGTVTTPQRWRRAH